MLKRAIGCGLFLVFSALRLNAACTGGSPSWTATPDRTSVNDCVQAAVSGDTIGIEAGSATWTQTVAIGASGSPKDIRIIGAGIGQTIITFDVTPVGVDTSSLFTGWVSGIAGTSFRISGMTVLAGAASVNTSRGIIRMRGGYTGSDITVSNCTVRLDHIRFENTTTRPFKINDAVCGVIDNNQSINATEVFVHVSHETLFGDANRNGNGSGAAALGLGDGVAVYFEDNYRDSGSFSDSEIGARLVVRFNTADNNSVLTVHGTENNYQWGTVRYEAYANDFSLATTNNRAVHLRSGNGVLWGNRFASAYHFREAFAVYRGDHDYGASSWGKCIGIAAIGPWDDNQAGGPFETGTHSGANGSTTITVSPSPGWTVGEWVGYAAYNTTQTTCNTAGLRCGSVILSNTADTITTAADHTQPATRSAIWNTGDGFEIWQANSCIGQTGFHGGTLLSGSPPSPTGSTSPALTPFYAWDNLDGCTNAACAGGVLTSFETQSPYVRENTSFYNQNNGFYDPAGYLPTTNGHSRCTVVSFDGTCGVGVGVIASRPATCTAGVGYWATNEGSWNDGSNSIYTGQGRLYKCTATDTWTLYYTPYTYPNPLVSDNPVIVTEIDPAFGRQGEAVAVTLTGLGFQGGSATINAISGITISSTTVVSDTSITATFTIAGGATLGDRSVTVTTDEGTSNAYTFEVVAALPAPAITGITPSSEDRGETASVTLTGTNFTGGTVSLSGTGVTTDNCKVVSATSITCDFIVAASTGWGLREVTVTNGSGTSNTANFFVSAPGIGPGLMRVR